MGRVILHFTCQTQRTPPKVRRYASISGIRKRPEDAVMLLRSLSGAWTENDGAVIGTDLRFWSKVSKFTMELLSKQHFVPGIVFSKNNMAFARWQYARLCKNQI
ncbi:MAG: hypothetical protein V1854_02915 [Methanobacteriota archaeon]